MKLTNINDNLSNYIFQASVKLSLVVSSVKSRKLSYTKAREILLGDLEKVGLRGQFRLTQSQIRRSYSSRERSS